MAIPPLSHVEEKLEELELVESRAEIEDVSFGPVKTLSNGDEKAFTDIKYTVLSESPEEEREKASHISPEACSSSSTSSSSQVTEIQAKCDTSFQSNNSTLEGFPSSSSEYEGDLEEESCADAFDTFDTSANDSLPSEHVHKPLKDLIFKANKEFYDVDSNKVRMKVGLSKKVPSLHPRRKINSASSLQ